MKRTNNFMNTIKRGLVTLTLAATLMLGSKEDAFASEVDTTVVDTIEDTVSGNDAVANTSLEDLLGDVDNTDETIEAATYAELKLNIPASVIVAKDGIALASVEQDVLLSEGTITLTQPTADAYKNRLCGDVTINVVEGTITVEYQGQNVEGTIYDELFNEVTFVDNTLTIVNSDKMEDVTPEVPEEEDDDDTPTKPEDSPEDYIVKYYKDGLQAGNYLGEIEVGGNAGENISWEQVELNKFQPESYSDGAIQDVVSATVVTSDDSDVVYVLYTRVDKEVVIEKEIVEVPVEVIKEVEVPVEVIKEVEVPVEVIKEVEVPVEVIKEVEVPVEVIKEVEVPVEVIKEVEVPVEVIKEVEVPVEVIKEVEVPVEVIKEVEVPVEVEKIVEKEVIKEVPVETIIEKEVIKEVPVVEYVEVPVEKVVTETVVVEVPVEKVVEVEKLVEVEKIVEVPGETEIVYVEVPTEKVVEVEKVVEKEVPVYVEVPAETDEDTTVEPEENPDPEEDEDTPINPEDYPQTGDEGVFVFVILMVIAIAGMVATRKKTSKN